MAAIVNLCATTFRDHFIFQRGECPGHLMDLIFFLNYCCLAGDVLETLKRDLKEDSFLLQAG